jgi:hypothetical protein
MLAEEGSAATELVRLLLAITIYNDSRYDNANRQEPYNSWNSTRAGP